MTRTLPTQIPERRSLHDRTNLSIDMPMKYKKQLLKAFPYSILAYLSDKDVSTQEIVYGKTWRIFYWKISGQR